LVIHDRVGATISIILNPFLFVKNKQLFVSTQGFFTLEKNSLICYQRAMLPIQFVEGRSALKAEKAL
jgi:hypothetical protein